MGNPSLSEIMKKAQEMQKQMQVAQRELHNLEVTGEAGAGLVKVVLNGKHDAKKVIITDEAWQEGKDILQDLITAAINDANRKVEKVSQNTIMDLTKQIGLPADMNLSDDDDK